MRNRLKIVISIWLAALVAGLALLPACHHCTYPWGPQGSREAGCGKEDENEEETEGEMESTSDSEEFESETEEMN